MVALDCLPLEGPSLTSIMPNKTSEPLYSTFTLSGSSVVIYFIQLLLVDTNKIRAVRVQKWHITVSYQT